MQLSERLIRCVDLFVCLWGFALIADSWKPLTWVNDKAEIADAESRCIYATYAKTKRQRRVAAWTHPAISGPCANEKTAKDLLARGYNTVDKWWVADVELKDARSRSQLSVLESSWFAGKQEWQLFIGEEAPAPGTIFDVRRSLFTNQAVLSKQHSGSGGKLLGLCHLLLGLILLVGTTSIYALPILRRQRL